jgi:uncharacterized protein
VITYVDTSVLIKLVVEEPGSAIAAELWDTSDSLVAARIGSVEARAAVAAAHRSHRLSTAQLRVAKSDLFDLWSQLHVVEVTETLADRAGDLAESARLRGYDALHLAAAETVHADLVATADRHLARAAAELGFHTAGD